MERLDEEFIERSGTCTFTDEDIDLLNMGISFSLSPTKHSVADLWLDFKRFERTLLYRSFKSIFP